MNYNKKHPPALAFVYDNYVAKSRRFFVVSLNLSDFYFEQFYLKTVSNLGVIIGTHRRDRFNSSVPSSIEAVGYFYSQSSVRNGYKGNSRKPATFPIWKSRKQ